MQALRSHAPLLAFSLSLAAIYGAAFVIVSRLAQLENADAVSVGLTLDLTVLVPLLYYLLMVRWRGWPAITVLPVFVIGVALAYRVIPDSQHRTLDLMSHGVALAELLLISFVVYKTVQMRRLYRRHASAGLDAYSGLRESACAVLGSTAGEALAYELAVLHYAVAGWRRAPALGQDELTCHRAGGYVPLVIGVSIAVVVETFAVHLLVQLWSPTVAWICSALGLYALLWLIGDTHAVRLRPIRISDATLHVRVGLRWTLDVPIEAIERIKAVHEKLPRDKRYLSAVLFGAPNRRIELATEVVCRGVYGLTRRIRTIDLQLDEPERFDSLLKKPVEA